MSTETDKRAKEREAHVRERTGIAKVGKEGPVGGKAAPRGSRRGSWSGRGHVGAHGIEKRVATGYVIGSYVDVYIYLYTFKARVGGRGRSGMRYCTCMYNRYIILFILFILYIYIIYVYICVD